MRGNWFMEPIATHFYLSDNGEKENGFQLNGKIT